MLYKQADIKMLKTKLKFNYLTAPKCVYCTRCHMQHSNFVVVVVVVVYFVLTKCLAMRLSRKHRLNTCHMQVALRQSPDTGFA